MFQYKAILKSNNQIVAEGHSVEDVENQVVSFRRGQKHGDHTHGNEPIEIIHVFREQKKGSDFVKEKVIKVI